MCDKHCRCTKDTESEVNCLLRYIAGDAAGRRPDPKRGTGRTQRLIVQSLCAMLMGKKVRHVMANHSGAKEALAYAGEWLKANGWLEKDTAIPVMVCTQNCAVFFGEGNVRFVGAEACIRGMRADLILEDHYAKEECERKRLEKERAEDVAEIKRLMRKHGYKRVSDYYAPCGKHLVFRT